QVLRIKQPPHLRPQLPAEPPPDPRPVLRQKLRRRHAVPRLHPLHERGRALSLPLPRKRRPIPSPATSAIVSVAMTHQAPRGPGHKPASPSYVRGPPRHAGLGSNWAGGTHGHGHVHDVGLVMGLVAVQRPELHAVSNANEPPKRGKTCPQ